MATVPDVANTTYSLDDLLEMGSDARVEIINGELIEMTAAGVLHHIVLRNIQLPLDVFVTHDELGFVFPDGVTNLMFSDPSNLKDSMVPDVSFIRTENIPADFDITKPFLGVPDLAVEIILPNDKAVAIQQKIQTYLAKGTEQVWVVYPERGNQSVHQYIQGSSTVRIYQKPEEAIDTSDLFPGLNDLTLEMIFKLPAWAQG